MEVDVMAVVLTATCCLLVVLTLLGEWREWKAGRLVGKPLASASFLALALHLAQWSPTLGYAHLIMLGLIFGAIGDMALMSKASRWFLIGLVSFLFGHVAYLVAFARLSMVADWMTPWALLPIVFALATLRYLWPHLGAMRVAVLLYMVAIVLMVWAALAVFLSESHPVQPSVWLLFVGALLFFASDVAVAKARFVKARFFDRVWGLSLYYAGQLCIAWSLVGIEAAPL